MDKMKLAHDWYMKHSEIPSFIESEVEQAWKYADAMQAEADERNKAEAEQKRKEMRELLNADNTFVEREGQHFDDVNWQPDWSQAPDNAKYWAMDKDGLCNWYENKPEICDDQWDFGDAIEVAPQFTYTSSWKYSLRERPEPKCEVDWRVAPKDATHYVIFADGLAYWYKAEKLECFDIAPSFGIVGMCVVERPHGF